MQITIRMDDITPDMDWERFYKVKAILDQYQVKPLIGVVPENCDPMLVGKQKEARENFWQYMKELKEQGWCIAMHGYRHIYSTKKGGLFPLNDFSEFAGLSYDTQLQMLSDGKRILEEKGIMTDLFMAPAHAYDSNTLKALHNIGFTGLTDGFGSCPYKWRNMIFYPISFQMKSSLKKKKGTTTMVLHAATMNDQDMERLENYLVKPGNTTWISYAEYLKQEPLKRSYFGHLKEYWLAKLKFHLVKLKS